MKLIGKGTFTTAYLLEDNTVLLHSNDPIKECMALGWFPESRLFPTIAFDKDNNYVMKYYPKEASLKSSLCARDYRLYQLLRKLPSSINVHNKHKLYSFWYTAFSTIPDEYAEEREALCEALTACSNCGDDVMFEIGPRNVAVDGNKLVLLDCFFMLSALRKTKRYQSA